MSVTADEEQEDMKSITEEENADLTDYLPSISDRLRIGYCSMDRACQTKKSEIVKLKEICDVLSVLVEDVAALKKNLYYSKLTLQAEYDGRLEEAVLELYNRVNNRIAEIEGIHKERVEVVRRSYKTQLSNAICKLSKDYHKFYGKKDAAAESSHEQKLKEIEKQKEVSRKNEIAQQEMFELLKMQMEDANMKAMEVESNRSSVVDTSVFTQEIDELKSSVKVFEDRVEYLEDMLEETNTDNSKLNCEVENLSGMLQEEQEITLNLTGKISTLEKQIENERISAKEKLAEQKESLKMEMEKRIKMTHDKLQDEAQKRMDDMRRNEEQKLRNQKMLEEQKIKALMNQHEESKISVEVPVDIDVSRLQNIEKKQRAEIARLQKELDRNVKMWELKVKILQENIHALKDEMFLRTTLQRQAAKMRQAALTYIRQGSNYLPLGVNPTSEVVKPQRRHQLPTIIQAPKVLFDSDIAVNIAAHNEKPETV